MPTKLMSYTFPAQGYDFYIDFPFRDVIQYGHQYLNTINVFRANTTAIHQMVTEFNIPKSKITWGMAIGCNQSPFEQVDMAKAADEAQYVKDQGLAGVMTWSLNRDTDHRTSASNGHCNALQTEEADGTFIQIICDVLQQQP